MNIMDEPISDALEKYGATGEAEIWRIHADHIRAVSEQGGRGKGFKQVRFHPLLIDWSMAFLAKTSASVYNEVAKVMMLPNISYVYKKTAEAISTKKDKAGALHMNTIHSIGERATKEKWTSLQRTGVIAQDSANIKSGIEHDYTSNKFVGGDETHSVVTLSRMFQALAQEVQAEKNNVLDDDEDAAISSTSSIPQNAILDNLPLAEEHLVFKFSSLDATIKCNEIVASVNVSKVTPEIITSIMISLREILGMACLAIGFATSDAAGCNWVSFRETLATSTFREALPREILDKYPSIDFDVKCLMRDPVTMQWIMFVADMPHLTKNIVTCLENSSSKTSKRYLKFGKAPVTLKMIEEIWRKCDGGSGQFHPTKLSLKHFDKDAYSRMNVALATQVLSASVAEMIRDAINDDDIVLSFHNKGIYNHTADFCARWNDVVDICNGRGGPHSPENARQRQTTLLEILAWLSRWKKLHDERVANETWFCMNSLILCHITAIQIYCIEQGETIYPRTMNTDTVEWHFGDARQTVGGSTNKLTTAAHDRADKKASMFRSAQHALKGNNQTGDDVVFGRKKRY
jgi:hypothetical protein